MENKKYKCAKCGYTYDPEVGDPKHGIEPGTPFEDLPEDWKCPRCRKPKDQFVEKEEKEVPTYMEEKTAILETMKKAGEPLNAGKIAELTGLDRKIVDKAIEELTAITGQRAVATLSKKDIANFKVRKKMPIGARVTLRRERMYEFLEELVKVALPRIRDFKGIESKLDGRGNYTLGIKEQIIFPEINIDSVERLTGMNITFVTTAKTDEEGYELLKLFGLPFKDAKNN